jgi:hypothetical protein
MTQSIISRYREIPKKRKAAPIQIDRMPIKFIFHKAQKPAINKITTRIKKGITSTFRRKVCFSSPFSLFSILLRVCGCEERLMENSVDDIFNVNQKTQKNESYAKIEGCSPIRINIIGKRGTFKSSRYCQKNICNSIIQRNEKQRVKNHTTAYQKDDSTQKNCKFIHCFSLLLSVWSLPLKLFYSAIYDAQAIIKGGFPW